MSLSTLNFTSKWDHVVYYIYSIYKALNMDILQLIWMTNNLSFYFKAVNDKNITYIIYMIYKAMTHSQRAEWAIAL